MQISGKRITVIVTVLIVLAVGGFLLFGGKTPPPPPQVAEPAFTQEVIGTSVQGRKIELFTFGKGETHLAFVGGIHGGYELNSVLLAYEFIDYLKANPDLIPAGQKVSVIPNANPDGAYGVTGKEGRPVATDLAKAGNQTGLGRFNAHGVDLNRNFDCKWKPTSSWKSKTVSAGTAPFSEPEAVAIRNFVLKSKPDAVIFWHSKANAVYASECERGILLETLAIMKAYAGAAGYGAISTFDAYPVSGDAEGWLASIGIPAITVELSVYNFTEWQKNLAGIKALFEYYNK